MKRLLIAMCISSGLLAGQGIMGEGARAAFADTGTGNSAAAHVCQKGGYLTLQSDNGQPFANQDDCVGYAAQGGTLYDPQMTYTVNPNVPMGGQCGAITNVFAPSIWCVAVTGSGFHPNSALTFTTKLDGGPSNTFPFGTTTDTGGFSIESFGTCSPGATFPDTITATDAQGLTATITATVNCP